MSGFVLFLLSRCDWFVSFNSCLFSEFSSLPHCLGFPADFLRLLLFLFIPGAQVRLMGKLEQSWHDLMGVQITAGKVASLYEAPEESLYSCRDAQAERSAFTQPHGKTGSSTPDISSHSPRTRKPRGALTIACEGGTTHTLGPQITGGHGVLPPSLRHPSLYPDCKVLQLLGFLWPLAEPEGHSILILLTCKPGSRAPRTAGRWPQGGGQGGHQKCSLTANFQDSAPLDTMLRILKFFLIRYHCSLISFQSGIWLLFKSFSQDSWEPQDNFSRLRNEGQKTFSSDSLILFQESTGLSASHWCFCSSTSLSHGAGLRTLIAWPGPVEGK